MKTLPGTERIQNIINTTLHTVLIKGNIPISLILVCPSGGGKSQTLLKWEASWIHHTGDITSQGLFDIMEHDRENAIRTIILPDFNLPLSHKASVTNLTVANMLSVLSEGIVRIDDGRTKKEIRHSPVSFLSAVTPDMYWQHYKRWRAIGLLRRFLLINYRYGEKAITAGMKAIREDEIGGMPLEKQIISKRLVQHSVVIPSEYDADIELQANALAYNLGYQISKDAKANKFNWTVIERALGFSPYVCSRTMVRANAIAHERFKVDQSDVDFLTDLMEFTSPKDAAKV